MSAVSSGEPRGPVLEIAVRPGPVSAHLDRMRHALLEIAVRLKAGQTLPPERARALMRELAELAGQAAQP